jgi:hypothetical protein
MVTAGENSEVLPLMSVAVAVSHPPRGSDDVGTTSTIAW